MFKLIEHGYGKKILPLKMLHLEKNLTKWAICPKHLRAGYQSPPPQFLKILGPLLNRNIDIKDYKELNQLVINQLNNCFPFHIDIFACCQ